MIASSTGKAGLGSRYWFLVVLAVIYVVLALWFMWLKTVCMILF
jgi:hypothetical protein